MPFASIKIIKAPRTILWIAGMLAVLYLTSLHSYLLFHSIVEIVTVVVAVLIFSITWNARRYLDNHYFLFIGIALMFVGGLDLLHAFAYQGMNIFIGYGSNLATQLWLAGRFIMAVSFLIAPFFIKRKINEILTILNFTVVFIIILMVIFVLKIFPTAYIEGHGLTTFKIISEIIIACMFAAATIFLYYKKKYFDNTVWRFLSAALITSMFSELIFSTYITVYSVPNMIGHLLKYLTYYLIYLGITKVALIKPSRVLYKNLQDSTNALEIANERYRTIAELTSDYVFKINISKKGSIEIDWSSKQILYVLGYNKEEMEHFQDWRKIIYPPDLRIFNEFVSHTRAGQQAECESRLVAKSGKIIWWHAIAKPIWDNAANRITGVIGSLKNINERKLNEEKLHETQTFLENLINYANAPIIVWDSNMEIVRFNHAFEHLTEYKASEVIGQKLEILFPSLTRDYSLKEIKNTLTGKQWESVEIPILRQDKSTRIALWNSANIYANDGKTLMATIAQGQDITERKLNEEKVMQYAQQMEQGKAEDEALLSNIADAIAAIDIKGKIIFTNRAFHELTGLKEEMLIGKPFTDTVNVINANGEILPLDQRPIGIALKTGQKSTSGTAMSSEYALLRNDGVKIPLLITAAPIKVGKKITSAIAVWHDISKEIEIDQAKNEFVSLASHQLRTPLASISLSAELLLRGIGGPLDDKKTRYLQEIFQSTQRMAGLIKMLLDVSRLELDTFVITPGPVDVPRTIDTIIQEQKLQLNNKKISLHRNYDAAIPIIKFDQNVLRIIAENLISNAIRYNRQGGQIKIELKKVDSSITITVADTGIGIPKKIHNKIFEKSFRADNAKDISVDGNGLGLYLVKNLADKFGATVWFESEENKGTTFYVKISQLSQTSPPIE